MAGTDKSERSSHDGTGAGAGAGGGASQKTKWAWTKIADETRWCFQDGVFKMVFSRWNDLTHEISHNNTILKTVATWI